MNERQNDRIKEAVGIIGRFLSENNEIFDEQNVSDELLNLGFTEKEIEAINFIDTRSGRNFFDKPNETKNHTNQKFYILEKLNK